MHRPFHYLFVWLSLTFALGAQAAELPDFTELVKRTGPSVVNISTTQTKTVRGRFHGFTIPDLPEDSPLRDFFRDFLGEGGNAPEDKIQARSLGSGFFISPDGYILTNRHVVDEADEILVRTSDRREFKAQVVGSDQRSDIALLKVDAKDMPVVRIGDAKELPVGAWVLAIGSPFGFDHSVTAGIVSAKGRSLPNENYVPFIQTDVAINPGNSGGPLLDLQGQVVGVNSQIYSRTGGFMGLSFAIPIDMAMDVAEQLKTKGRVSRGWLGVLIQDVNRDLAETFGMASPQGALVAQVLPKSPAEQAGIQVGDVILAYNGRDLPTSSALPPLVGSSPVEAAATLRILRNGKEQELKVVIGELPEEGKGGPPQVGGKAERGSPADRLGLVVMDPDQEQRQALELPTDRGVLVEKVEQGSAKNAGLRAGDVLLMLNHESIRDAAHFRQLVKDLPAGKSVAALVQREDNRMFMALRVPE